MFLWWNKENIHTFGLKKASYQELWQMTSDVVCYSCDLCLKKLFFTQKKFFLFWFTRQSKDIDQSTRLCCLKILVDLHCCWMHHLFLILLWLNSVSEILKCYLHLSLVLFLTQNNITIFTRVFRQRGLREQCRPWSNTAHCRVWSGFTLFAIKSVFRHIRRQ